MNLERLKKLCSLNSVTSNEIVLKNYFKQLFKDGEFIEDKLGSVFYHHKSKKENTKTLLITCSGDEVGLMLQKNNDANHFDFINLEPLSPASLLHQQVQILKDDDSYSEGIIVHKKNKFNENPLSDISIKDLEILCYDDDVKVGDLACFKANFTSFKDTVISKSLNQKAMLEVIISLIEKIKTLDLDFNLCLGFTAASTIGFRGSETATFVTKPDLALVLTGFETSNSNPGIKLNDGVIVGQYDKQMLPNRDLIKDFKAKINTKDYFGFKGNDGSFIHKTLAGCPSLSVGIAISNIDTPVEVLNINDLNKLEDAILHYIKTLSLADFKKFGDVDEN